MAVHLETLGAEFLVKGFQQFFGTMKKADTSIDELGTTSTGTSGILNSALSVALGQGLVAAATAAFNALMKVGGAMVGFVSEGFDMAVDFQSSLVGLELAAGATGLSFDQLHDAAIAVGGDTRLLGVSASGAAEAMTGLFKAGLTEAQVMGDLNAYVEEGAELTGALRASIDLAAASELDMVQAADLASVVISTFGDDAKKAGMNVEDWIVTAMDNLVRTADASVADVGGLQEALINVGPAAAASGQDLQDVNAALGILSEAGIQGGSAGTKLNSMFNSLRATTPGAQAVLDKYNISLRDTEGNMLPLPELLKNFEQGLDGLNSAEKDAALSAILTTQGLQAMDTLLKSGSEGWEEMESKVEGAASMMDQAAKKADTYAGKMEAFEGVMETLKIQIGEALLPVATQLLEWITSLVEQYGPSLVAIFQNIGIWVENLAEQFSFFTSFLSFAVSEGDSLNDWLQELPGWFQPIAVVIADVMYALDGMWAGLVALISGNWDFPWEDVFPPVVTEFLYQLTPILYSLSAWLQDILPQAIEIASGFFTGVLIPVFVLWWTYISEFILPLLAQLALWFLENLPIAISAVADFIQTTLMPAFTAVGTFILEVLVPALSQVFVWLQENLPPAIAAASDFFNNVLLPAITVIAGFVMDNLIPIITTLYGWLMDLLPVAIEIVSGLFNDLLLPILTLVWGFITENLVPILTTLADTATAILGVAITVLTDIWENILMPVLNIVWDFIETVLIPIIVALADTAEAILGLAITALTGIFENVLMPAIEALAEFWEDTIQPILQKAADEWFPAVQGAIEGLTGPISSVVDWLGKLAEKIRSIKLPDWMQPGSPPPLFYALEDIAKGMKEVSGTTVKMGVEFDKLPAVGAALGMVNASGGGYVRPVAANQVNSPYSNNTNTYDQSRTVNQNFIITPDVLLESIGSVAA